MSRRKKNLRAFLYQNENPTIEQAWDAAWEGAQKIYHSQSMQALEAELKVHLENLNEADAKIDKLRDVLTRILDGHKVSSVDWDAMRDGAALLEEGKNDS